MIDIPKLVDEKIKEGTWKGIKGMQVTKNVIELVYIED